MGNEQADVIERAAVASQQSVRWYVKHKFLVELYDCVTEIAAGTRKDCSDVIAAARLTLMSNPER